MPAAMDPAPDARLDAAPPAVVIRFTERVEPRASSLEVLDAQGRTREPGRGRRRSRPIPGATGSPLGPLPPGAYTVSWRVLSADDGHVTSGAHVFTVGVAGPAGESGPTVRSGGGWRPLARWLVGLGGALLLGALVGGPLLGLERSSMDPRAWRVWEAWPWRSAGRSTSCSRRARSRARARRVGVLATLLATPPGLVWLVRSGLLVLLAILLTVRRRAHGARRLRLGVAVLVVMIGGLVTHGAAARARRAGWRFRRRCSTCSRSRPGRAGSWPSAPCSGARARPSRRRGRCPPRARDAGLLGARRAGGGAPLGERALPRPAPPRRLERAAGARRTAGGSWRSSRCSR